MIETGIKTLKINAIKINKTLAEGNKSMKKLRAEEQTLFRVQQNKIKLKQREDLIEGKKKQKFGSGIAKKVIQPARSFIDKLKDFFILLGAGILVNSLPAIIASIEKFTEDNKGLIDNIKFIVGEIGKLSIMFIELTQKLTPGKEEQIKKDLDELSKFLGKTDGSEVDESLKELKDIEKELGTPTETPGSLPINPNPIPPDQRLEAPINSESNKPVQVAEFNSAAKKVIEIVNNNNSPTNTKVFLPGVGYAYRSPTALGSSSPKFEGPVGTPMTKDEFFTESRKVEENIKGYSKGGTVKGTSYDIGKLTLDSKPVRTGSGVESFSVFKKTTIAQANNLGEKTKSNNLLEDLVDNVKKLFGFEDKDDKDDKEGDGGNGDGARRPRSNMAGGGAATFETISGGEGGVNSVNRGTAGDTPGGAKSIFGKNLTEMTVGEIMDAQARGEVSAVGKYQIIPGTMRGFVQNSDVTRDMLFTEQTQDMFKDYVINVKRPSVGKYLRGETNDPTEAGQALAREFASVGLQYAENGNVRGSSRYAGTADNAASISPEEIIESLKRDRDAGSVPKLIEKKSNVAPLPGLKVNNPNIDRSSILSMQSPNDVSSSTNTLVVFAKQNTFITEA